jgi:glycosyltransferase involved in cell wall biosynthesis
MERGFTHMKLAVITSTYPRYRGDGVGSFIHSLMRTLAELQHEVTVLAPHDPAAVCAWQSEVTVKRVRFVWPDSWSLLGHARSLSGDVSLKWHAYPLVALFSFFATLGLWREVKRQESDIIYAQWLIPGGFIGAVVSRLTGVPLVVSVHGSDVFVAERHKVTQPAVRLALRSSCHLIACSGDLARRVLKLGMPSDRVSVVPYGVDVERYKPDQGSTQTLRTALHIPDGQHVIMAMGRLVYKKGFSYLIEAMPGILARCPESVLLVAGQGDLDADLEQLAESLGIGKQVIFAGHVAWDQTPAYLALADLFVLPSILDQAGNIDGLPNVLLEAMASGCAIIASNVAGVPDVLTDGQNGLLVPEKDVDALTEAISKLLDDPLLRQRLGDAARATTQDHLSWTHIAQRVTGVLNSCSQESK